VLRAAKTAETAVLKARKAAIEKAKKGGGPAQWRAAIFEGGTHTLGEPYARHLGGKARELRFTMDGNAVRITYWLAPDRRIVLRTVFRKARQRESGEVERAQQVQKVCEAEHGPAEHGFDRTEEGNP
jgi:hypothetical protein